MGEEISIHHSSHGTLTEFPDSQRRRTERGENAEFFKERVTKPVKVADRVDAKANKVFVKEVSVLKNKSSTGRVHSSSSHESQVLQFLALRHFYMCLLYSTLKVFILFKL